MPPVPGKTPGQMMRENPEGITGLSPDLPGLHGQLPLKSNRIYKMEQLTPSERKMVEQIGLDPTQGVPEDMAKIIKRVWDEAQAYAPPAGPDHKVEPYREIDITKLPPAKQSELRAAIQEALETTRLQQEADKAAAQGSNLGQSVQEAVAFAQNAAEAVPQVAVVNDLDKPTDKLPGETGLHQELKNCPHCQWELSIQDDVVVTDNDKNTFVAASLGNKDFVKQYSLFDGDLVVTFRSLSVGEIDAIWKEVADTHMGDSMRSQAESWELVQRYRCCLQIIAVSRLGKVSSYPDGLSPQTNASASEFWSKLAPVTDSISVLEHITATLYGTELRQEMFAATIRRLCNSFNRLVSKLEAMADSPEGFWKPTGE